MTKKKNKKKKRRDFTDAIGDLDNRMKAVFSEK